METGTSNKTTVFMKSMNMDIWIVDASNELFIRSSYAKTRFSKKQSRYWQNSVLRPFCTPYSTCLKNGF